MARLLIAAAILLFILGSNTLPTATAATTIGVSYSAETAATYSTNPPIPARVASTVSSMCLTSLRMDNMADPTLIGAFVDSNTSLLLTIPNELVQSLGANRSNALRWLTAHVVPFFPRTKISTISVGNQYLQDYPEFAEYLLPAIKNVYLSLSDLGIHNISVSSNFDVMQSVTTPFPPSQVQFKTPAFETVIGPLLQFLRETGSPFLVQVHPYVVYRRHRHIPVGFALFEELPLYFIEDKMNSLRYYNLFDMMVDSVISAMAYAGHHDIPLVVTETGWPSYSTDSWATEANFEMAQTYIKGLLRYVKSGRGTPLRKQGISEIYVNELLDDKEVNVPNSVNWGILYPNMTNKYPVRYCD